MSLAESVLEHLQGFAEEGCDIIETMFSGYHGSYRKMWRSIKHGPKRFDKSWAEWYRDRKRFYTLLNALKRGGLVEKKKGGSRRSRWVITEKGSNHLSRIQAQKGDPLSLRHTKYARSSRPALILVVFDIPEREKRKRRWLRESLKNLGFSFLQRSVWLGKTALPSEFIHDLRRLKLIDCVHILAIGKTGTIHELLTK